MTGPLNSVGILAGGGIFPLEIARSVAARGGYVHVIMIEGDADDALLVFPHTRVHWSKLGRAVKALRRAGIGDVILVGTMARPDLKRARPDLGFVMAFPAIVRALTAGGDDALLRGILGLFVARGFRVVGAADVAPELLIGDGPLGIVAPRPGDESDIARGFALIAALGRHDIGQAAVVSGGVIEAIEGAEGTDRMIGRVLDRRRAAGADPVGMRSGVLIKRPKPGQDVRVDLPAIGPDTVQLSAAAGLAGIAAMSGYVLTGNRPEVIRAADHTGLFVAGIHDELSLPQSVPPPRRGSAIVVLGSFSPLRSQAIDIDRGIRAMSVLAGFATGSALVVRKKRVIAVGAAEPAVDVVARVISPAGKKPRRWGVAILGPRETLDATLVEAAAGKGLAGVVVMYGAAGRPQHKGPVIDLADKFGLFIAAAPIDDEEASL